MSQFGFGSNVGGSNTASPGFGFGAAKQATPTFGSLGTTQPAGSITFGTPIASVAPTQQQGGLSFGTPTLGTGTGLNFGTPASASTAPTLGTGLAFGTPTPAKTGLSFGTPTATPTPTLNFGATSTTAQATPGLSFGVATTSAAPTTGLSFGTPASTGGASFGGLGGGSGFFAGTAATSQPQPTLGGLNFGTAASSAPLTLSTSSAAPTLSFGLGTATTSAGLSFNLGTSSTAAVPTLNFKTTFTPTTGAGTGLNFGFSGAPKTQATPTLSLGTTTTSAPIGLGGVDSSQTKTGTVTSGRTDTVVGKDNPVPNEIIQTIDSFKQFVKDQKVHSSDVSRGSARPFLKVGEDIDLLNSILSEVGNELERNRQLADKLKHDCAKCIHNAEMAQRTNDTPPGLQFENNAPMQFFIELVNQLEQDLQTIRVQIDITDKHFQSLQEPKFLTSQELAVGMRRLHDTFVALAGRLQSVHSQVESQKEQYLNLRKYILKDPTNIFAKPTKQEEALEVAIQSLTSTKTASGPTPFSSFASPFGLSMTAIAPNPTKPPPPAYPATTTALNFSAGTTNLLNAASTNPTPFGNTATFGQQPSTDSSGFQLQSPPPGNKRGKR